MTDRELQFRKELRALLKQWHATLEADIERATDSAYIQSTHQWYGADGKFDVLKIDLGSYFTGGESDE